MREWLSSPLGQLVAFQKGRKVEVSDHARQGFAPYLGAGVLAGDNHSGFASKSGAVLASEADVLMLWDGERSGLVGIGKNGVVSSTVSKICLKASIDPLFLYYVLDSKFSWIQGRRTGTGVPHVPKDLGRILTVCYPSDENAQKHTAEILSSVDDAIEQTEALIAKTQQIKAGLMHDLFTRGVSQDGRLRPAREEAPQLYKESPLGWIPKEWDVRSLDDVRDERQPITYGALKPGPYVENGIPLLQIEDVIHGELDFVMVHRISTQLDSEYSRTRVTGGEIVISLVGTIGRVAQLPEPMERSNLHRNLGLIAISQEAVPRFFYYFLHSHTCLRLLAQTTYGSTQSLLNLGSLRSLATPLPSLQERRLIADALDSEVGKLDDESAQLRKLRQVKAGLMHDLLTGHASVAVAVDAMAEAAKVCTNV